MATTLPHLVSACDIRLCPVHAGGMDELYAAVGESRAEIQRFMGWCTPSYSRADAVKWIELTLAAREKKAEYSFFIQDASGRILGTCGLNRIDALCATANLGYWVRTSATGRGVCTAAVALLRNFAFTQTELFRLEIMAAVENVASQRVAEKSGATREGVLRQRLFANGVRYDTVLYSILRSDSHPHRRGGCDAAAAL